MHNKTYPDLDRLFHPRNVAIVGASPRPIGIQWGGNTYIEGSISLNFKGKLFPVHPKAESILGYKAYRRISDIPEDIDLVIFSVPHSTVLSVMHDCVKKRVKFVHLFTAGFSETGRKKNAAIEAELLKLAREGGIRIVGPNCMGLYCPEGGLSWARELPNKPGAVGFISQSGQLAGHFIGAGSHHGLSFSKVVSFGNGLDLKCHDFLQFLARDEKTKIIGAYLEGLKDGRAFFEAARNIALNKPLVVWKGGQFDGGARAAKSHTGSMAGSLQIFRAACEQLGIIIVNSLEEMVCTVVGLRRLPLPRGKNVAILGGGGGGSVTMTDAAEREGLNVPQLSQKTIRGLQKFVPVQGTSVRNPLDMMLALIEKKNFMTTIELLRDDPNIDALIFLQPVHWSHQIGGRASLEAFIEITLDGIKTLEKPMFIALEQTQSLDGEAVRLEALEKYNHSGIPTFPSFSVAARVVDNMSQYHALLARQ
ncbi:acetate--CoA ligase family protein [Thermodesulfobacteriota bacterium]